MAVYMAVPMGSVTGTWEAVVSFRAEAVLLLLSTVSYEKYFQRQD